MKQRALFDPAPDAPPNPRAKLNANGGPPDDPLDYVQAQPDPLLTELVRRSLKAVCVALGRDAAQVGQKRKGDDALSVRQALLYALKPFFGRDDKHDAQIAELAAAAQREAKRIEAAHRDSKAAGKAKPSAALITIRSELKRLRDESLSKQKMLAVIVGLDRGTVADDQAWVDDLINPKLESYNAFIAEQVDNVCDLVGCIYTALVHGEDFIADMVLEKIERRKAAKGSVEVSGKLEPSPQLMDALSTLPPELRDKVRAKWGVAA